jgi:hypothetical protein
MVMEPTDFRHGDHLPTPWELDRSRLWTVHRQRQMGTKPMIISKVAGQEALQMLLVQDDHLIQTRAADAPNEALDIRMLPRTAPGNHHLLDSHVLDALPKSCPIDTVAIAQEIPRCLIPRKRLNDLLRGPLRRGMLGHVEVVLWLLGLVTASTLGGFIHLLLVIAVVVLVMRLLQGRPPVEE